MINRRAVVPEIGLEIGVVSRWLIRIVDRPTLGTAVSKRSGYPDRAYRIESIGILDNLALESGHGSRHRGSLERERPDDVGDVIDDLPVNSTLRQPCRCHSWTGIGITAVKFPVGDVMQKGSELDHKEIRALFATQSLGQNPHPVDVPPVVTTRITRELIPNEFHGPTENL